MCLQANRQVDAMRYILKAAELKQQESDVFHEIVLTAITSAYDLKLYALSLRFAENLALLSHAEPHGFMLAACAA